MKKPTVPEVLPLVYRLYLRIDKCSRDSGGVGGHLHVVLDDGNVETTHVEWCLVEARKDGCATCIKLAELLKRMSMTQRSKLSNRAYDGAHENAASYADEEL